MRNETLGENELMQKPEAGEQTVWWGNAKKRAEKALEMAKNEPDRELIVKELSNAYKQMARMLEKECAIRQGVKLEQNRQPRGEKIKTERVSVAKGSMKSDPKVKARAMAWVCRSSKDTLDMCRDGQWEEALRHFGETLEGEPEWAVKYPRGGTVKNAMMKAREAAKKLIDEL